MHNVAYYVHTITLMCNILHIIRFYFSLHNVYIITPCYTNIAYFLTDFYANIAYFSTDFYAR